MSATERVIVDLPADLVEKLRERVAAGDIQSESEALREGLASVLAPDFWNEEWLEREVGEIYDRVMAGEEELIPAEQVFDEIRAEIAARAERQRDRE
jgi:Arc/MetJ-type ribon-helix-helix transcriptional regulator